MKKTNIITILLIILVIGLTGYIVYDKVLSQEEKTTNNNENQNDVDNNIDGEITTQKIYTQKDKAYYVVYTKVDKNGKEIWKYSTETVEENKYEPSGTIKDMTDKLYINNNGTIVALNKVNGKIIWENKEFKGTTTFSKIFFDQEENIYIHKERNLIMIDNKGNTKFGFEHEFLEGEIISYEFSNNKLLIKGTNKNGKTGEFAFSLLDYNFETNK